MIQSKLNLSAARFHGWPVCVTILLAAVPLVQAQGILGTNLIVNGNAEAGPAGTSIANITGSIPGWARTENANVLPYNVTGLLLTTDPAPPDHGFQYFASGGTSGKPSTLTQDIDVSSVASMIGGGNVKYTASAYLGSLVGANVAAQVTVDFKNAGGQVLSTATLGPRGFPVNGMSLQQQVGLVPAGTVRITVTLTLNSVSGVRPAVADSLTLVLNTLGTSPGSVLGANLVVNGDAEAGPSNPLPATALYIPGWSSKTSPTTVEPYGATDSIAVSASGPTDRGVKLFCGSSIANNDDAYQDIDVSPAAALIDSGKVTYEVSAWLGSTTASSPTLTYIFFDWSGLQLAPTAQLGPTSHSGAGLVETSHSGTLPSGTRRVHISLTFTNYRFVADDISFTLSVPGLPVITPAGVLSAGAFGGFSSIAPGSWIEIYGTNLAPSTQSWQGSDFVNGVAPTSLAGVKVSIGGRAAFIDYVSPSQIDALIPSDVPTGTASLTVTDSTGVSDGFAIAVNATEPGLLAPPAFLVGGKQYLAALSADGSFAIPQNAISGLASRPAKPGDTLIVYGIGFGPVSGGFTAGTLVDQQNSLTTPVHFFFGTTEATVSYDGLAPSFTGLYQFNVVVPNVAANDAVPISFSLGDVNGSQTLYIAVQN